MSSPSSSSIAEQWKEKTFEDVSSYTHQPYPIWMQNVGQTLFRDAMIDVIGALTRPLHPLDRTVDLACGIGDWTLGYLDFSRRVTGVDISPDFVEQGRQQARDRGVDDRAEFTAMNLLDFDDFDDADLVCLGACLTCVDDMDARTVVEKISNHQNRGQFLYVRTTVVNPFHEEYQTDGGFYRPPYFYDGIFEEFEYDVCARQFSASVIPAQILFRAANMNSYGAARAATAPIAAAIRAFRMSLRENDYMNWILRRR